MTRFIWGGVGKFYIEPLRTLFLAEVDGVHLRVRRRARSAHARSWSALAGFAVLPVRGVIVTVLGERNQIDVAGPRRGLDGGDPARQLVPLSARRGCR